MKCHELDWSGAEKKILLGKRNSSNWLVKWYPRVENYPCPKMSVVQTQETKITNGDLLLKIRRKSSSDSGFTLVQFHKQQTPVVQVDWSRWSSWFQVINQLISEKSGWGTTSHWTLAFEKLFIRAKFQQFSEKLPQRVIYFATTSM